MCLVLRLSTGMREVKEKRGYLQIPNDFSSELPLFLE